MFLRFVPDSIRFVRIGRPVLAPETNDEEPGEPRGHSTKVQCSAAFIPVKRGISYWHLPAVLAFPKKANPATRSPLIHLRFHFFFSFLLWHFFFEPSPKSYHHVFVNINKFHQLSNTQFEAITRCIVALASTCTSQEICHDCAEFKRAGTRKEQSHFTSTFESMRIGDACISTILSQDETI